MSGSRAAVVAALWLAGLAAAEPLRGVAPPPPGTLYHGVYPGGVSGDEDDIGPDDVAAYETTVGHAAAWVVFSNNWFHDRIFPSRTAEWIRERGAVPWVRLMLRLATGSHRAGRFGLKHVLRGDLDEDLRVWARGARAFGSPVVVEFGTECNGFWFPWNAKWNGKDHTRGFGDATLPDGAERFAAAYRRIVGIAREEGALNLTWVFHVNWADNPDEPWNRLEAYYPGDDVVDWVALSAYGPQLPFDDVVDPFVPSVDAVYPRLRVLAPTKPVVVIEFGATAGNPLIRPDEWATPALDALLGFRWPHVIGFSWWNERWENDDDPTHDTTMRVQDVPALAGLFRQRFDQARGLLVTGR